MQPNHENERNRVSVERWQPGVLIIPIVGGGILVLVVILVPLVLWLISRRKKG